MVTGSIPTASIWGTWSENVEVWDVDSDDLMDLTEATEITLKLKDPYTGVEELTLTMSGGDIVIVSMGIIQWRVEQTVMALLSAKLYEIIMTLEDGPTRSR
jgi:hypothetical protein